MKARRELTAEEIKRIKEYSPSLGAIRFSKKQLEAMGFPYEGGGLVRINGEVYAFVSNKDYPNKSHVLGPGGHGKVKLLQNVANPKDHKALKVIFTSINRSLNKEELKSMQKELKIAAALGQGSEQTIQKIGESSKEWAVYTRIPYYGIFDFIPGITISDYLKNNQDEALEKRLKMLIGCLKQMNRMHNKGYVHNDLQNLSNIIYDDITGSVKIIDFGRAESLLEQPLGIANDLHAFATSIIGLVAKELRNLDSPKLLNDMERNDLKQLHKNLFDAGRPEYMENRFEAERSAIRTLEELLARYLARQALGLQPNSTNDTKLEPEPSEPLSTEQTGLNQKIDQQIKQIKKDGGYDKGNWKDPNLPYSQKLVVLEALKEHLLDNMSLKELSDIIGQNSQYNKGGFFQSKTKKLLKEVLAFKQEPLSSISMSRS